MTSPSVRDELLAFYDPTLYRLKAGPASRVDGLYRRLAVDGGGPILELGCGTGDVLLAVAREGIEAWGCDLSHAMLDEARQRLAEEPGLQARVRLIHQSMEELQLATCFRQMFLPNDLVAHVLDDDTLLRVLTVCHSHTQPGGRVVLDIPPFDVRYLARHADSEDSGLRHRGNATVGTEGDRLQVWERTVFNEEAGILTAHFRYEDVERNGTVRRVYERTLRLRPRRPAEVLWALRVSGFCEPLATPVSDAAFGPRTLISARRASELPAPS